MPKPAAAANANKMKKKTLIPDLLRLLDLISCFLRKLLQRIIASRYSVVWLFDRCKPHHPSKHNPAGALCTGGSSVRGNQAQASLRLPTAAFHPQQLSAPCCPARPSEHDCRLPSLNLAATSVRTTRVKQVPVHERRYTTRPKPPGQVSLGQDKTETIIYPASAAAAATDSNPALEPRGTLGHVLQVSVTPTSRTLDLTSTRPIAASTTTSESVAAQHRAGTI